MPRRPRIDFPGAFHHVYARGIEKRDIFADDIDLSELRRRILKNIKRFDADCLAWAFMPNHFHLLFRSKDGNLSDFMRCLMSGYSIYFNKKYRRVGHLFQNRYKSSTIDSERYLLELIRYIHLNPVRSGILSSLESLASHRWTSHFDIMSNRALPWDRYPFIREFFSSPYMHAIDFYLAYLYEGLRSRPDEFKFDVADEEPRERIGLHEIELSDDEIESHRIFLDILSKITREHSISRDRILDGRRDRISSCVRREILRKCVHERGMARNSICSWLGITAAGGTYHLKAAIKGGAPGAISAGD